MATVNALYPLLLLAAALAAFGVGVLLAGVSGFPPRGPVLGAEILAVAALFLAGLASREGYAPQTGRWSAWGRWRRESWQTAATGFLGLGGTLVILLQGVWRTGYFTIPLGALGVLGGYFVFAPPVAWHRRGWGEFWAGLCFGLLPVLSGFYLQSRHLISEVLLYGAPLSLTAFNLFLLLGFPGPGQESEALSLASRLGPVGAALLYTIVNILVIVGLVVNVLFPAGEHWSRPWLWALIGLAVVNQESIKRRAYYQEARIRLLCVLTLALLLGMNLIFVLGLWGRW